MKRVLFLTDFSDLSLRALPAAVNITTKFQGHLHIIHVLKPFDFLYEHKGPAAEDAHKDHIQQEMDNLRERIQFLDSEPEKTYVTCLNGNVIDNITKYSKDNKIDLIVMSTHGYSGLKRLLMGNTTHKLLRTAPCPLFVYNPSALEGGTDGNFKRVVLATDFSDIAKDGLSLAAHTANQWEVPLTILHSIQEIDKSSLPANFADADEWQEAYRNVQLKRLEQLDKLVMANYENMSVETTLTHGVPEEALSRYTEKNPGSLVVMATHGYSGAEGVLLGSAAERILQTTKAPALVFNPAINRPYPFPVLHDKKSSGA